MFPECRPGYTHDCLAYVTHFSLRDICEGATASRLIGAGNFMRSSSELNDRFLACAPVNVQPTKKPHHPTQIMNPFAGILRRTFRLILPAFVLATTALAQSNNGAIDGRVSSGTGQYLQGAIVRVIGTELRSDTGRDGSFDIRGVPAGNYEVEASYFGLQSKRINLTVAPGQTAIANFNLGSDAVELAAVRVEAEVLGQARAINQQRVASAMVNITSEEQFGEMTGNNVARALQRIPGISTNSDGSTEIPRFVNIRGFDASLNSVQLNGNRLPTTNDGTSAISAPSRGFALDDLPASAVTNIVIVKAQTPDLDGDAIGGIVNLITKSAFDREGRAVDYNIGVDYMALRESFSPHVDLGYGDILMDGRLAIRLDLSYYKRDEGFDNIDYDWLPLAPGLPANRGYGLTDSSVFFHEDTEYNNYFIESDKYGAVASIEYKLSDTSLVYFKPFWNYEDRAEDDRRFHKIMDNDHARAAPTTAVSGTSFADTPIGGYYTAARGRAIKTGETTGTYSTYTSVTRRAGSTTLLPNGNGRGSVGYRQSLNEIEPEIYALDFGGQHELDWNEAEVRWGLFYANATRSEIRDSVRFDRNAMQWAYDRTDILRPQYNIVGGPDPFAIPTRGAADYFINPSSSNIVRQFRETEESVTQARTDLSLPFFEGTGIKGTFKTGAKVRLVEREHDRNFRNYRLTNFGTYDFASYVKETSDTVSDFRMGFYPDTARIINEASTGNSAYVRDISNARLTQNLASDYEASEDSYEGYTALVFDIGPKLQLTTGVRVEHTEFSADTPVYDATAAPSTDRASTLESRSSDYTQALPGIQARYEARNNIVFRANYNQSYARPSFRELVAVTTYDENANVITTGNPNLDPYTSQNWDISAEYFGRASYFQVALFHKKVEGQVLEIGQTLTGVTSLNGIPLNPNETYTVTTFSNEHDSTNRGIEVVGRYKFLTLPAPFDGLFVDGSVTYTDSNGNYNDRPGEKLPTYGGSEWLYYAALGYEKGRFAAQISYRFRSPYLEGLENVDRQNREFGLAPDVGDDWWGEEEYVNLETSYKISEQIKLYCNISNLLEYTNYSTQSPYENDYPEDSYWHKMRLSFGIKGSF